MGRSIAKLVTLLCVMAAAVAVAALIAALRSPVRTRPLPNPNGYDDLISAAQGLGSVEYSGLGAAELRTLVSNNAAALKIARTGLSRESRVRLTYNVDCPHVQNLGPLKRLAQAFVAEGRLAELENRPADAVQSYLAAIRVAQEGTRGGVLIDGLVAVAIEALGVSALEKLAPKLDSQHCRQIVVALEEFDSRREPASVILQQEHSFTVRTYGVRGQIARWLPSYRKTGKAFVSRANAQMQRTQRLMITLAAEAYKLDHGQSPADIGQLVPAYLKAIPRDPLTRTNATL